MYESFYKLRAKPFRLSPDPGFFFASRGHKRALAYLRYGLSQGEGFVVITGAPGTGKTTLAQILLKEMGQSDVVVAHLTTTQLDADDMLRMVAASFGLRYEGLDKAGLLKTLESFLLARSRERKRALLVVDEAQNLPAKSIEELRMLSNLQVGDKALLQTFLLGQAQFRQMMEHPDLEQLRQRVIANYHLSSLAPDECQSYVESRLRHVGWNGDPRITAQAYQIIHGYTEGVPRRINMLCDRVLLFGSLEERHQIDEALLRQVTDELQQEISGRPLAPVDLSALSENEPKAEERATQKDFAELSIHVEETTFPVGFDSEVSDLAPSKAEAGESTEKADEPEPQMLDRAEPDGNWQRPSPKPDRAESHQDADADAKTMEKERFRVIPGGKGATPLPEVPEEMPNVAAPAVRAVAGSTSVMSASNEPEDAVLRKILRLVLAFHRSPRSFPGLDDPTQPLPKGIRQILQLAVSDDQVLLDLRQIAIMGISPAMMRAAVRFFVRRVLFLPGGDDYRALGLSPGAATAEIEVHYGLLMRLMRQEKPQPGEEGGVSRIGEAYERLCRGEVTTATEAEPERELGDIEDIEELDLDLAPNLGTGRTVKSGGPIPGGISALGDDGGKGNTMRNAVLVTGAAVIVFVLYLTQIRGTSEPENQLTTDAVPAETTLAARDVESSGTQTAVAEDVTESTGKVDVVPAEKELAQAVESPAALSQPDDQAQRDSAALMAEVQARLRAEAELKARDESEARARAQAEAKLKAEAKARAQAESKLKEETAARAVAEAQAKAELQARLEAESKARSESDAKAVAEAKAIAEAQAKAELQARLDAEAKTKAEAEARAAAEAQAKVEAAKAAEAKAKADAEKARVAEQAASAKPLGAEDLNRLVKAFVSSYEAGNIDNFMALFAADAQTNDRSSVQGIREDYTGLFKNSVSRKMSLKNFRWDKDGALARGEGKYTVEIQASGKPAARYTGSLWIQVENSSGKVLITHLAFVE